MTIYFLYIMSILLSEFSLLESGSKKKTSAAEVEEPSEPEEAPEDVVVVEDELPETPPLASSTQREKKVSKGVDGRGPRKTKDESRDKKDSGRTRRKRRM